MIRCHFLSREEVKVAYLQESRRFAIDLVVDARCGNEWIWDREEQAAKLGPQTTRGSLIINDGHVACLWLKRKNEAA